MEPELKDEYCATKYQDTSERKHEKWAQIRSAMDWNNWSMPILLYKFNLN